jgi:hypothetical protein
MVNAMKINPRAMDIFIDELTISDMEMPKNHQFLLDRKMPVGVEPVKPIRELPQSTMTVNSNFNSTTRGSGRAFGSRGGSI